MSSTNAPEPSQRGSPATSADKGRESRATSQQRRKKRVRHFTADDRAAHRVFEKERREAFRERLLALAELLPSLADRNPQALSKHTVVEEGIAHITAQKSRLDEAAQTIRALVQERDELLGELNRWRSQDGTAPRQPSDISAYSLPQIDPGVDSQIRLSPTHNPAGIDSLVEPASGHSDIAVLPEAIQADAPPASLGSNCLPEAFDISVPPIPVSLIDQSHVAPGLTGLPGESLIGPDLQQPAQTDLFEDVGSLSADLFDASFVLEDLGPVIYDSANPLNLPVDLHTYTRDYLV